MRTRGPRESRRLNGSRCRADSETCVLCRYAAEVTSNRSTCFVSQPTRIYSVASQSSNSGCERRFALHAEILAGLDEPDAEQLFPEAIDRHSRRERVVGADEPVRERQAVHPAPGGGPGNAAGKPGDTASPLSRKLPRR